MAKKTSATTGQGASIYTLAEVMQVSVQAFGVPPEVAAGAARAAGRTEMSRDEWKAAIESFLRREV